MKKWNWRISNENSQVDGHTVRATLTVLSFTEEQVFIKYWAHIYFLYRFGNSWDTGCFFEREKTPCTICQIKYSSLWHLFTFTFAQFTINFLTGRRKSQFGCWEWHRRWTRIPLHSCLQREANPDDNNDDHYDDNDHNNNGGCRTVGLQAIRHPQTCRELN